jgi:hypothetical protein
MFAGLAYLFCKNSEIARTNKISSRVSLAKSLFCCSDATENLCIHYLFKFDWLRFNYVIIMASNEHGQRLF